MSELIAITYTSRERAAEVLQLLRSMREERRIDIESVCTVTREPDGTVQLHQALDSFTGSTEQNARWASLVSLLFLAPFVGLILTVAGTARANDLAIYGVDHDFIRGLRRALRAGASAVFALIRGQSTDAVWEHVAQFGSAVLRTALASDARLRLLALLTGSAQTGTG